MKRFVRRTEWVIAAAIAALLTSPLHADDLFWEGTGVSGGLTDANYFNTSLGSGGEIPTPADVIALGGQGDVSLSTGVVSFQKLRVGQGLAVPTGYNLGPATLTVSNGAQIELTGGGDDGTGNNSNGKNAGLWVGLNQDGSTLNIDGVGSRVTSNNGIAIGVGSQAGKHATVNITNGGALIATDGHIKLGERHTGASGIQDVNHGHLLVNGTVEGPTLFVGLRNATSTYTQTGGDVFIGGVVQVASQNSGPNNASTFSISGGTFTNGGHFFVGRGDSDGATVNISGAAVLNVGDRFLVGGHQATGVTVNHSGGTLNAATDLRVGDGRNYSGDSTYNLSGTGVINSTTGGIVGRQGTGRFFQIGGEANFFGLLRIGAREAAPGATDGLYRISGGVLNAGAAFAATDALSIAPKGTGEFRVVGDDASINLFGNLLVNNTADGVGTLAFELETGDLLSTITATDSATFSSDSRLVFDVSQALPTQTSYDLLTATTITDEGIDFQGPAGWSYQIVGDPGLGQTLQAVGPLIAPADADFDADGDVDGADFLTWQRGVGTAGATLADGDANGDQAIDGADLAVWKAQFGATPAAAAAVPEPIAGVLLLTGMAAVAVNFRRNRKNCLTRGVGPFRLGP